jgi:hypothetical protein
MLRDRHVRWKWLAIGGFHLNRGQQNDNFSPAPVSNSWFSQTTLSPLAIALGTAHLLIYFGSPMSSHCWHHFMSLRDRQKRNSTNDVKISLFGKSHANGANPFLPFWKVAPLCPFWDFLSPGGDLFSFVFVFCLCFRASKIHEIVDFHVINRNLSWAVFEEFDVSLSAFCPLFGPSILLSFD